ncbi:MULTISPECIES: hypothetical protein [Virgibacillus]|uniref:Transposase IS111A/IS1328/IS1533 N-terminal domain-containing protein n=1 Tax=Virgibacillus dokdonensis TaxID=302167 RepID=A0ABU7VE13_9BACI|nr:hypothetical protein [Virgibacillus sp.]NWO13618.1 hypothetical protein [Virgibacillus sp.]
MFNVLENDCDIVVANVKYVNGIRSKKNDIKDSIWLCNLHKHSLIQVSITPSLEIHQIRE